MAPKWTTNRWSHRGLMEVPKGPKDGNKRFAPARSPADPGPQARQSHDLRCQGSGHEIPAHHRAAAADHRAERTRDRALRCWLRGVELVRGPMSDPNRR